jgi:Zn-dependent protease/predicted RNA-binding Zn-ribbon protein involved in translation (DUF1610 family)
MPSERKGSIHLFRLVGVDLYLHWSWFVVAAYEIQRGNGRYSSILWGVLEYLSLFLIVLMHEFGHAMACRQVGGTANRILLWPFGGVAYVKPPQRPGATLWSIAAGPLVNIALLPILVAVIGLGMYLGWAHTMPNAYRFVVHVTFINVGLLVFNLLPIYPLDGGQILRSLLWYVLGRGRSLMVTTVLGFIGIVAMIALAVFSRSMWSGGICVFMLMNCWGGLQRARALLRLEKLPRRSGFACPSCHSAPLLIAGWRCNQCKQLFDTFETRGVCPNCGYTHATTVCADCQELHPMSQWVVDGYGSQGVVSSSFSSR